MEHVAKILKKKDINVNNDNKHINANVNNVPTKSQYALDRSKFIPNTPKTQLAEKIAIALDDLQSFAGYLSVVNKMGYSNAERLLKSTLDDIKEKAKTSSPVRKKGAYFMWKFKKKMY